MWRRVQRQEMREMTWRISFDVADMKLSHRLMKWMTHFCKRLLSLPICFCKCNSQLIIQLHGTIQPSRKHSITLTCLSSHLYKYKSGTTVSVRLQYLSLERINFVPFNGGS